MKQPTITIDRQNKVVTVTMPLETARPSKATGKTMVIASTRGLRTSAETYARRPVWFTANVVFYPANRVSAETEGGALNQTETAARKVPRRTPRTKDEVHADD
jgi:hypothetical protein